MTRTSLAVHRQRPLRVALFGLTVTLVGYALLAAWLGGHAYAIEYTREHTATSMGDVVERGVGPDGDDILVRWQDRSGRTHVQRFPDRDATSYTDGTTFLVAYDPAERNPSGRPIDWQDIPKNDGYEDDLLGGAVFSGFVAAALCGVWAHRGLRFRRLVRRPGRPATALVRTGERRTGPLGQGLPTTWLVLDDGTGPRRQRVMWHPALDELPDGVPVTVHGRRTALVVLPDGTRLVPLGRLHRHDPRQTPLDVPSTVRGDLRDSFIVPAGTVLHPVRPWWRPVLPFTTTGAGLGIAMAYLDGDGTLVSTVALTLAFTTLLTSAWALLSPQP
ncbi:hypothetical protein [Streptomyces sp. S.PB5]|uniref:hypothetical protein n=1 Tax=Streptomyces sp. S.PB5 TaxID=3020844 RepID=UPI0025B27868|nr:hypothetical protein [Streptomyces sp. S.PB5]MDN3024601.1 hypothetical protein [Streptomyces sp. S.PB5]